MRSVFCIYKRKGNYSEQFKIRSVLKKRKYFKCEEIFNELVGKSFDVYIVGYANDGMNSGFEILLPEELKKYYINYDEQNPNVLKVPHITASLKEGAKASNTKNLKFEKLSKPVKVTGKFGFWIKEEDKGYLSYKPYLPKKCR